jgi:succinyl-diaminopimelate desuccinylase
MDVISLTRKLLSFNTINPPGNESKIAGFIGDLLVSNGFQTKFTVFEEGRLHLVAERGLSEKRPPLVFSGHFDTVPLGNKKWLHDPLSGETSEGKIWGRGTSDMKGGLAAMILASIEAFNQSPPEGGIRFVLTAAEELGCLGVQQLVKTVNNMGQASAIVVAEPTANLPATGHKGALYLNAVTTGLTAHSSMPGLGINAIYKAARAIVKVSDFKFDAERDPLLGFPTINVGKMNGGMNINSVPDHAEFSIDIRTTTRIDHEKILVKLSKELGDEVVLETLVDLKPVYTDNNDPFTQLVYDICGIDRSDKEYPKALPYLTDGSVLQRVYNGVPTIILGPGQPEMAHQTDEFCFIDKLENSVNLYKEIILKWRN